MQACRGQSEGSYRCCRSSYRGVSAHGDKAQDEGKTWKGGEASCETNIPHYMGMSCAKEAASPEHQSGAGLDGVVATDAHACFKTPHGVCGVAFGGQTASCVGGEWECQVVSEFYEEEEEAGRRGLPHNKADEQPRSL